MKGLNREVIVDFKFNAWNYNHNLIIQTKPNVTLYPFTNLSIPYKLKISPSLIGITPNNLGVGLA